VTKDRIEEKRGGGTTWRKWTAPQPFQAIGEQGGKVDQITILGLLKRTGTYEREDTSGGGEEGRKVERTGNDVTEKDYLLR